MGRKKKLWKKSTTQYFLQLFKVSISDEIKTTLLAIFLFIASLVVALALLGFSGSFGVRFSSFLVSVFGFVAYLLPLFLLGALWLLLKNAGQKDSSGIGKKTVFSLFLFFAGFLGLWHLVFTLLEGRELWDFSFAPTGAGAVGVVLSGVFLKAFGAPIAGLILIGIMISGLAIMANWELAKIKIKWPATKPAEQAAVGALKLKINAPQDANFVAKNVDQQPEPRKPEQAPVAPMPIVHESKPRQQELIPDAVVLTEKTDWKLPPFDILDDKKTKADSGNIEANAAIIRKTLSDFGISVEMGEVNVGPTVTQYTLRPAIGVKLSQIAALKNDLALALAASSLRMELPIPGKPYVGVEVPNRAVSKVLLRDVMQTPEFINHKSPLAFALGRDVSGAPVVADLVKMPHMLIAGSTGTGKSVALNSLILSLLYRNTPQRVKLIMIDPKRVEMRPYNGIPHLITAPIMDSDKAVNAMKWAVNEMDRRFKLVSDAQKKTIVDYNESAATQLPYIVIIIDEMADLMTVAQADIEAAIVRLAQMARAVGIHLVLATQSPRVDIITGLIKANISSRMAFKVTSQSESRIILDMSGADQLLGNGDMLFVSQGDAGRPRRVQGSFVTDTEVHKVAEFFIHQAGVVLYNDEVVEKQKGISAVGGFDDSEGDEFLDEAKQEVLRAGKASASFLQRRLKIGYARAARILDLLEQQGVVGPGDGAKPREVYGATGSDGLDDDFDRSGF